MKIPAKWICTILIIWFIAEPLIFSLFNLDKRMNLFMEFAQIGSLVILGFMGVIFGGKAIKSKFNIDPIKKESPKPKD